MRPTVEIDDRLMAKSMKASGATSKWEVVELGLRTLVQLVRQQEGIVASGRERG